MVLCINCGTGLKQGRPEKTSEKGSYQVGGGRLLLKHATLVNSLSFITPYNIHVSGIIAIS